MYPVEALIEMKEKEREGYFVIIYYSFVENSIKFIEMIARSKKEAEKILIDNHPYNSIFILKTFGKYARL